MTTRVISTFSQDGYELYGKKMLASWLRHWPSSHKISIYGENFPIDETDQRLTVLDLHEVCPNLVDFKNNSPKLDTKPKKEKNKIRKTIKWAHKVYAMQHALESNEDYVIFLDGDTYTCKDIPADFAEILVEDDLFAVHFEKLKGRLHFETGLVVFNLNHPKKGLLQDVITTAYDNLSIYDFEKSWDGFWFAHLFEKHKLPVKNLGSAGVFCNRHVKGKLVHNVGPKKYEGTAYNRFTGKR